MKISELIEELKQSIEEDGDLDVVSACGPPGPPTLMLLERGQKIIELAIG